MNPDPSLSFAEARRIIQALNREGVDYVVVGSMAMAAQGLPRATRDIDFFVSPEFENIERLKAALKSLYEDPNIEEIDPKELAGDYPAVEYNPPHGEYSMDILTRLGEKFRFDEIEWETGELDGVPIRVATPEMLYRMKRHTVRPQDRADAERIRDTFDLEEV